MQTNTPLSEQRDQLIGELRQRGLTLAEQIVALDFTVQLQKEIGDKSFAVKHALEDNTRLRARVAELETNASAPGTEAQTFRQRIAVLESENATLKANASNVTAPGHTTTGLDAPLLSIPRLKAETAFAKIVQMVAGVKPDHRTLSERCAQANGGSGVTVETLRAQLSERDALIGNIVTVVNATTTPNLSALCAKANGVDAQ